MDRHQTTKRLAITVLVTAAVIVTVFSEAACLSAPSSSGSSELTDTPGTYTINVLCGQLTVNYKGLTVVGLYVPENAKNASIHGDFSVTCNDANNAVMFMVLSGKDLGNWLNSRQFTACYNQDLMPAERGGVNVTLSSGPYYIVMASTIYMQSETVTAQIDLAYTIL
jgi:hypothetical protein